HDASLLVPLQDNGAYPIGNGPLLDNVASSNARGTAAVALVRSRITSVVTRKTLRRQRLTSPRATLSATARGTGRPAAGAGRSWGRVFPRGSSLRGASNRPSPSRPLRRCRASGR